MSDATEAKERSRRTLVRALACALPLLGLVELGLHVAQTTSDVVPDSDWVAARNAIKPELQPADLVVFEPFWADPIGREAFGELATLGREGRSDDRRFPRAFEISSHGKHDEELASWKKLKEQKVGALTVTLFENPSYTKVIDDLVDLVKPGRLTVSRVEDGTPQPCTFQHGASSGGSTVVPQGLLTPGDKFVCQGGHVGVAVLHALDHHPHLCIYATPMANATVRLTFSDVTYGTSVHGHSGIQWQTERTPSPDRVAVSFSAFDRPLGTHAHKVGVGWVGFELPTDEIAGKKGDLVVDIAPSAQRQFCFEATTRRGEKE